MIVLMALDSLSLLSACALFAACVGAWVLSARLRTGARLYLRFCAMLFAGLALSLPLQLSDIAALFLLPLGAASLMITALARFARPLPVFVATLTLIAGLGGGLAALLSGATMLALVPVMLAGLAIIAAALNGLAVMPALAGAALLACGLMMLEPGSQAGLFLFCAAALMGLATPPFKQKKSALAVQH
jgi:hypothetical protein